MATSEPPFRSTNHFTLSIPLFEHVELQVNKLLSQLPLNELRWLILSEASLFGLISVLPKTYKALAAATSGQPDTAIRALFDSPHFQVVLLPDCLNRLLRSGYFCVKSLPEPVTGSLLVVPVVPPLVVVPPDVVELEPPLVVPSSHLFSSSHGL